MMSVGGCNFNSHARQLGLIQEQRGGLDVSFVVHQFQINFFNPNCFNKVLIGPIAGASLSVCGMAWRDLCLFMTTVFRLLPKNLPTKSKDSTGTVELFIN
jgi:hypothetical protein